MFHRTILGSVGLLIAVAMFSAAHGQQLSETRGQQTVLKAKGITDDFIRDVEKLETDGRAILTARLADTWWNRDESMFRQWMLKAIELVGTAPESDSSKDRLHRLATRRYLFRIVITRDRDLSKKLVDKIVSTDVESTKQERDDAATTLVDAAIALIDKDPSYAADLGTESLKLGRSLHFPSLLWRLRSRDQKTSDRLFLEALTRAQETSDAELLSWLTTYAFKGPSPSDASRSRILTVLADGLRTTWSSESEKNQICRTAPIAANLLPEFSRLLPQRVVSISIVIRECQSSSSDSQEKKQNDPISESSIESVEELLSAADRAGSSASRDRLIGLAARKAAESGNHDRAISIWDTISEEGRKMMSGVWESVRWGYAEAAVVNHLKLHDRSSANKILADSPSNLRGCIEIAVARTLFDSGTRALALEFLRDGQVHLWKATVDDKFIWSLSVVRLFSELDQAEVPTALKNASVAINQADSDHPNGIFASSMNQGDQLLTNDLLFNTFRLPASLVLFDELGTRYFIAEINSGYKRAAIRLGLIRSLLEAADKEKNAQSVQVKDE